MERVEGMMRGMRLSEAEATVVKIDQSSVAKGKAKEEQAVGKLLAN
jgi:hypothetical protein